MDEGTLKIIGASRGGPFSGNHEFYIANLSKGHINQILEINRLVRSIEGEFDAYGMELFAPGILIPYEYCPPLPVRPFSDYILMDEDDLRYAREDAEVSGFTDPDPQYAYTCTIVVKKHCMLFKWYEKHVTKAWETDEIDLGLLEEFLNR